MELAVPVPLLLVSGVPSRRLPFDPRSCGICGGQSGTRAIFSPSTSISPVTPHTRNA
jgi:hypothetical protein